MHELNSVKKSIDPHYLEYLANSKCFSHPEPFEISRFDCVGNWESGGDSNKAAIRRRMHLHYAECNYQESTALPLTMWKVMQLVNIVDLVEASGVREISDATPC